MYFIIKQQNYVTNTTIQLYNNYILYTIHYTLYKYIIILILGI